MVQVRALRRNILRFRPGGVEQDEQRARGGAACGGLRQAAVGDHARASTNSPGTPYGCHFGSASSASRSGSTSVRAQPKAKVSAPRRHQPAGVAGLERLMSPISRHTRGVRGTCGRSAQAVAGHQAAARAARALYPPRARKGLHCAPGALRRREGMVRPGNGRRDSGTAQAPAQTAAPSARG